MISTAKAATVRASSPSVRTPSPLTTKLSSTPPSTPKTMPPQIKKNHTAPFVRMEQSPQAQAELASIKKTLSVAEKNGNTNSNSNVNSNANSNINSDKLTSVTTSNAKSSAGKSGGGGSSGGGSSTSSKKSSSPRKLLPCKDREFDANKHCGVWLKDIQKHCTRSLTCKTHALSLRRAVQGRRKPFDELLAEHRARREKELQEKGLSQAKLQQQHKQQQLQKQKQQQQQHQDNQTGKSSSASVTKTPSPPKTSSLTSHPHKRPLHSTSGVGTAERQSLSSAAVGTLQHQSNTATDTRSSDGEYDAADDLDNFCPYVTHQPKPAAMCSFGARLMGRGCYVFNRKTDHVRSAFMSLVERHLHPPPFKKLCVATKSPLSGGLGTHAVPVEYANATSISAASSAISGKIMPSMANGPLNKSQNNSKKCKPSNKQAKAKDTHPTSKSKARRKSGGGSGGGGICPANVMPSLNAGPVAIPLSAGNATGFSINPATYTDMTPNILSASTGNLIKDLSIVVTNIDANVNSGLTPGQVINGVGGGTTTNPPVLTTSTGQLVTSNMSGHLATVANPHFTAAGQTYQISQTGQQLPAGVPITNINIATSMQGSVINTVSGEKKLTNVATGKVSSKSNAKSRSKSSTNKQSNMTRVHNVWQSPTTSANVSRTENTISYDANSNGPSSAQPSPSSISTTPSPHFRPGSISPQMPVQSPLPNGIIPSPSAAVNLKGFPVSTINHFHSISPSRNSTPSPITITSSTEASPNNSGQFTSNMFTATNKTMSAAAARVNTNFQKQVQKQSSVVTQPSPIQQHVQLQQQSPQITANIVTTGKPLHLNNALISNSQQLFNMQPLQTIRLPIQQTLALQQQTAPQKTLEQKQTLLGQTDEPM
ncbi:uncharacterized protein LOC144432754 isoform X2 [Glandiceps talaboti]